MRTVKVPGFNAWFKRGFCLLLLGVFAAGAFAADVIVDNGDAGTSFTGAWAVSGGTGAYGADSLWGRNSATYTWTFDLPSPGSYEVFMWWTEFSSRSDSVPVRITHALGTSSVTVNQQTSGSQWNSLGVFVFEGSGSVTLRAPGAYPTSYCADAVKVSPANLSEVIIDNRDTAVSMTGTWPASGGENPYGSDSVYNREAGNSFSWLFTPPAGGYYEVSMWWTEFSSRSAVTPVEIDHAGGTASMTVNQQVDGGKWNVLGEYQFEAGQTYAVRVLTLADRSSICADAVRFVSGDIPDLEADFSANPASGQAPLTVGFTDLSVSQSTITSWQWDFDNDGTVDSTQQNPTHTYSSAGQYTVKLTVTGASGTDTEIKSSAVTVSAPSGDEIVVDNGDAGTSYTGTWTISGGTGAYGTDSLYGRDGSTYTWEFSLPSSGSYEVFMWWTEFSSRSDSVPVAISHSGGTSNITINQQTNGGQWNSLGVYTFGSNGSVTLTAPNRYPTSYCADAIRVIPAEPSADVIIDNRHAETSMVGSWPVSGGENPYGTDSVYNREAGNSFSWLFTPASSGYYEVSMWWTEFSSRSAVTPVEIEHAGGTASTTVNQLADGGQWNTLGTWQFTAGQTYAVSVLTLSDRSAICADAVRFRKTSAPAVTANFSCTPTSGQAPLAVNFTDLSTSPTALTSWQWDFDNNGTVDSTQQNPSYTYSSDGTYSVKLTVSGPSGSDSVTRTNLITVSPSSGYQIIVDDGDPGTSSTGTWDLSGGADPYDGDSLWARYTATYTWRFTPTQTGQFDVYMWWTVISSRGTAVPVAINHAGGTANVTVNQLENGGQWNLLGTYNFDAGTEYSIVVRTPGGSPTACADAVRLVRTGSQTNLPPTATITSISPNPAQSGQTVYFSGTGTDPDGSVTAYQWTSNLDGTLSSSASFNTDDLSAGTHTISFRVRDNSSVWSTAATASLIVTTVSGDEHIFACFGYGTERVNSQWESMLEDIGATLSNGIWRYTRAGKTYLIHTVTDVAGMRTALRTPNAHVMFYGHSNYGLGQIFCTSTEWSNQSIPEFQYVDDDRILNCSTDTVSLSISGMIEDQAYPNWYPEFSSGSSAIMPYTFGGSEAPPYNYYLTYRIPGDSTYYRIISPRTPALERFPGCGSPAWYSSSGAVPNPNNTSHRQYYITNSSGASWEPLFNSTSGWSDSVSVSGYWKSNYVYTGAGSGSQRATWTTSVTSTGSYDVFARWAASSDRTSEAPYTISHAGGSSTVRANQRTNGASWNLLGRYNFNAGTKYPIVLTDNVSSGYVIADAVYLSHSTNPPYVLQSDFYASPRAGSAPFEVTFRSLCTGEADKKIWNFGDGGYLKDSGTTFRHTYTSPGTYSVTLTSSAAGNTHAITKTAYIVVGGSEPARAEFSANGREGFIPRSVTFTNRSSGNISSVRWDFGDGSTSTANNPSHTYSSPGNYTVSLRVTFSNGSTQTVTKPNFVRATRYEKIFDNITFPPYHYGSRTILKRGPIEVDPSEMRYNRMFMLSCNSGSYYMQVMGRGLVFYSLDDTELGPGPGFSLYLRAYLEGKSNDEILAILKAKANFDYYDFNKRPDQQ